MTSLPLPLRGNHGGRPGGNGKKGGVGQIYGKRRETDTKPGFLKTGKRQ